MTKKKTQAEKDAAKARREEKRKLKELKPKPAGGKEPQDHKGKKPTKAQKALADDELDRQIAEREKRKIGEYVDDVEKTNAKHGYQFEIVPCLACEGRGYSQGIVPKKP